MVDNTYFNEENLYDLISQEALENENQEVIPSMLAQDDLFEKKIVFDEDVLDEAIASTKILTEKDFEANIFSGSIKNLKTNQDQETDDTLLDEILEKYSFDWDMIDVIIGGKSSIDLSRVDVTNLEDAENFIKIYGYDLAKENINLELKNVFREALTFIEDVLIPDPFTKKVCLEVPEELKNLEDIRHLLLYASDYSHDFQNWACAILRVMHTISHVNNDISLKFFPEIQRQILDRLWSAIYVNPKGEKYFGFDEKGIKIYDIDIKARKERNSTILKLLHKIENVAADVFDQIGVRIITYDKTDALLVVRSLRKNGVIDFCNVKPSRSINRLIDVKVFKKILNYHKERLENGEISREEFEFIIKNEADQHANIESDPDLINPYMSKEYRAIQFTCRQMIRMNYPLDSQDTKDMFTFFFPYELQVVDINTHLENHFGKASHDKYKEKQLISARRRVLGRLIKKHI